MAIFKRVEEKSDVYQYMLINNGVSVASNKLDALQKLESKLSTEELGFAGNVPAHKKPCFVGNLIYLNIDTNKYTVLYKWGEQYIIGEEFDTYEYATGYVDIFKGASYPFLAKHLRKILLENNHKQYLTNK